MEVALVLCKEVREPEVIEYSVIEVRASYSYRP